MKVTNETRALAHEILAYWLRFNRHEQSHWVRDQEPQVYTEKANGQKMNVCGSTMCAAGTAVFLTSTTKEFKTAVFENYYDQMWWTEKAGGLLGLDDREAHDIFHSDNDTAKKCMAAIADGDEARLHDILDYDYVSL